MIANALQTERERRGRIGTFGGGKVVRFVVTRWTYRNDWVSRFHADVARWVTRGSEWARDGNRSENNGAPTRCKIGKQPRWRIVRVVGKYRHGVVENGSPC